MKKLILSLAAAVLAATLSAADSPTATGNDICPVTGKRANPSITLVYEDRTYAFADESARSRFDEDRKASLYHRLGGKAALDAAIEKFYVKVLADERIKHFFEDINMNKQRRRQKEFLAAAFGGPIPWAGKDLAKAHANIPGLNETHFNAVAENLQKTLEELNIKKELIAEVMAIAGGARDQVLNRQARK
jgi:hemoglobin